MFEPSGRSVANLEADGAQACPSLKKVLDKVLRRDKPQILDIGTFCAATAVYLADRGARVSVDEFLPPAPTPPVDAYSDEPPPVPKPLRIEQPDATFHLVLAWEAGDFIPRDRLAEFGAELNRVLAPGGWVLLFSLGGSTGSSAALERRPRYRVLDEDKLLRERTEVAALPRYVHPPRDFERALAPLLVQGIHLQRNQLREFLLLKRET